MNRPDVVVKVGGSLLDWERLPERLTTFLDRFGRPRLVLIAGGGPAADWVRRLDGIHGLGEERSHQLALFAMDLSAHVLTTLISGLVVVEEPDALGLAWEQEQLPVLAPRVWFGTSDHGPDPLPHSWEVTSDSIAARLALELGAGELVLLKSADLPDGSSRTGAARLGRVDPEFPKVAAGLETVRYLNLRDPDSRLLALS